MAKVDNNISEFNGTDVTLFAERRPHVPKRITVPPSTATFSDPLFAPVGFHYINVTYPAGMRNRAEHMRTITQNTQVYAPKIHRVLKDVDTVINAQERVLIAANGACGIDVLRTCLRARKHRFFYIPGNGKDVTKFGSAKKKTKMSYRAFVDQWKQVICEPTACIVLLDTDFVAEGLNLPGITHVFSLSRYKNLSAMQQTFGRVDRMCTSVQKLELRQYIALPGEEVIETMLDDWTTYHREQ